MLCWLDRGRLRLVVLALIMGIFAVVASPIPATAGIKAAREREARLLREQQDGKPIEAATIDDVKPQVSEPRREEASEPGGDESTTFSARNAEETAPPSGMRGLASRVIGLLKEWTGVVTGLTVLVGAVGGLVVSLRGFRKKFGRGDESQS